MSERFILTREGAQALLEALQAQGRRVIAPRVRDGAIVYDDVAALADLPRGVTEVADAASYRLARRDDDALFGYAVGPQSWKRFLHAPIQRLWRSETREGATRIIPEPVADEPTAFLGVRACELAAIAIQDKVFLQGGAVDPHYRARRENAFVVAVDCGVAGGACFCASTGTGPEARGDYDIALTELVGGDEHAFVARAGTTEGRDLLARLPHRAARPDEIEAARAVVARTAQSMGRVMPTEGLRELLERNAEHPRWEEVAQRCLSCANCTMVCPTCFCTSVEETSDLAGVETARTRRWDSCFTMDFSYVHGGAVRTSGAARYRQWMTHKLSSWFDQFGTSGCVGCGRCIVWCPVGIDITEEVRAIRDSETRKERAHGDA